VNTGVQGDSKAFLRYFLGTDAMTTLRIGTTLLIVKYLTNNHGNPYYQRRIPDDLQARFGKKKFSIPLDANKGSAAFQAQRLAKSHDALFKALRADPNMALSEEKCIDPPVFAQVRLLI
jgi:hypothetical protein